MQNDVFETMPVRKAYFRLALPVVMGMVVSLIYNMVDTYFIAQTGNTNLVAGVSLGAPIFTLMISLGDILGLGGSSVIARLFGSKQDEDGKRLSIFCFYGAFLGGLVVSVLLLLGKSAILTMLGADQATRSYAAQYYTFIALGAPFIIFSFSPGNLLRSEGFAQASMIGSVLGAVINMLLDPLFIYTLGMGAGGAAVATVIGYIVTDLYYVWFLQKRSSKLSLDVRRMKISMQEVGQILAIGIPASITNLMQSIAIALTNRALLPYGNDRIAAMGIVMKINMIAALVLVGFAFGGQPLVGYNYGADNKKRLREILRFAYSFACGLAALLAVTLSVLARPMMRLFVRDAGIIEAGVVMLRWLQVGMPFMAIVLVTTCTFQAAGKALGAFILSASRQGVIFILVLVIGSRLAGYYGVLSAQAVSDMLTAVTAVLLYRRMMQVKR